MEDIFIEYLGVVKTVTREKEWAVLFKCSEILDIFCTSRISLTFSSTSYRRKWTYSGSVRRTGNHLKYLNGANLKRDPKHEAQARNTSTKHGH